MRICGGKSCHHMTTTDVKMSLRKSLCFLGLFYFIETIYSSCSDLDEHAHLNCLVSPEQNDIVSKCVFTGTKCRMGADLDWDQRDVLCHRSPRNMNLGAVLQQESSSWEDSISVHYTGVIGRMLAVQFCFFSWHTIWLKLGFTEGNVSFVSLNKPCICTKPIETVGISQHIPVCIIDFFSPHISFFPALPLPPFLSHSLASSLFSVSGMLWMSLSLLMQAHGWASIRGRIPLQIPVKHTTAHTGI